MNLFDFQVWTWMRLVGRTSKIRVPKTARVNGPSEKWNYALVWKCIPPLRASTNFFKFLFYAPIHQDYLFSTIKFELDGKISDWRDTLYESHWSSKNRIKARHGGWESYDYRCAPLWGCYSDRSLLSGMHWEMKQLIFLLGPWLEYLDFEKMRVVSLDLDTRLVISR